MLHGREPERAQIESLLERARARRSGVLLLRGDTGIGKSALLDDAVARAHGMAMLRAGGVDTESELAYAALHQLLRPVLHRIDALPATQADALPAAFGELAPAVAEPLLTVAAGNPLALCELPSSLTADQLVGREGIEYPLPVRDHVERALRRRIAGLGEHARALLVLAAADDTGDWPTLRLAALLLDIDPAAMEELEEAGLLVCDERGVVFPQPLVRSVAYRGATS